MNGLAIEPVNNIQEKMRTRRSVSVLATRSAGERDAPWPDAECAESMATQRVQYLPPVTVSGSGFPRAGPYFRNLATTSRISTRWRWKSSGALTDSPNQADSAVKSPESGGRAIVMVGSGLSHRCLATADANVMVPYGYWLRLRRSWIMHAVRVCEVFSRGQCRL